MPIEGVSGSRSLVLVDEEDEEVDTDEEEQEEEEDEKEVEGEEEIEYVEDFDESDAEDMEDMGDDEDDEELIRSVSAMKKRPLEIEYESSVPTSKGKERLKQRRSSSSKGTHA